MRGSFNATEPARPSVTTLIADAPANGPFPPWSLKPEAKRKPHVVFAAADSLVTQGTGLPLYTVLLNSA